MTFLNGVFASYFLRISLLALNRTMVWNGVCISGACNLAHFLASSRP